MKKLVPVGQLKKNRFPDSFTLVELLTVIAIIAILAALVLGAASGVMTKAARSRASAEIQAISTALDGYKTDNGAYPVYSTLLTNTPYSSTDGTGVLYQGGSQVLYQALSGQVNYLDTPVAGVKVYMSFKKNQLGNTASPAGSTGTTTTYVQDPWGYSYGYSTGTTNNAPSPTYPYNGSGFFDLWSTGGNIGGSGTVETNTSAWVCNWQ